MATGASGEMHAHHDRSYSSYPRVDRWHSYSGNAEAAEYRGRDLSDLRGRDWNGASQIASHLALTNRSWRTRPLGRFVSVYIGCSKRG
jgi:hypothetical protein